MSSARTRTGSRPRKRAGRKGNSSVSAKEFIRHTFYYLKSEHLLKVSRRLLFETA